MKKGPLKKRAKVRLQKMRVYEKELRRPSFAPSQDDNNKQRRRLKVILDHEDERRGM